ncbi:MAG: TIGR02996 domain-containing protein, partial [Planctomycetales bacterium]
MPSHEMFLQEIRDSSDPSPSLVYADWLEEQGDKRCEFLRAVRDREEIPVWVPGIQKISEYLKRIAETGGIKLHLREEDWIEEGDELLDLVRIVQQAGLDLPRYCSFAIDCAE